MAPDRLKLYSYWRSSAAYRVRIALNLKELPYELIPVNLIRDGGEQLRPEYLDLNPQGLVPVLLYGQRVMRQSLAIIEFLDEQFEGPRLLSDDPRESVRIRALSMTMASEIQPLINLRTQRYLEHELGIDEPRRTAFIQHFIKSGLDALEVLLSGNPETGTYCEGDTPTMADCCLIPQLYSARRFGIDLTPYPTMLRIERACLELPAFEQARPENQPDAPGQSG